MFTFLCKNTQSKLVKRTPTTQKPVHRINPKYNGQAIISLGPQHEHPPDHPVKLVLSQMKNKHKNYRENFF
jgi:hypothetical protein